MDKYDIAIEIRPKSKQAIARSYSNNHVLPVQFLVLVELSGSIYSCLLYYFVQFDSHTVIEPVSMTAPTWISYSCKESCALILCVVKYNESVFQRYQI